MTEAEKMVEEAAYFASGRCGAKQELRGETFDAALAIGPRWFPTIRGQMFMPPDPSGFHTRVEAVNEAQRIKRECQAIAASAIKEGK